MKNLTTLVNNYQNELLEIDNELKKLPAGNLVKRKTTFYHWQAGCYRDRHNKKSSFNLKALSQKVSIRTEKAA